MRTMPVCFKCLVVSGVLVLLSVFSLKPKLIGVAFIVFIAAIIWNMAKTWPGLTFGEFNDYNYKQYKTAKEKKQYFKSLIYATVGPAVLIGVVVIVLDLFCFLVLM